MGSNQRQCFVKPAPDAGVQIGDVCATNAKCLDLGTSGICKLGADDNSFQFPHGFCTEPCSGVCPGNSTCLLNTFPVDGGTKSLVGFSGPAGSGTCFKNCDPTQGADVCGDGFFCNVISQPGNAVCLPLTPMPNGVAGRACKNDPTLCANPPSSGFCYPESTANGLTGFSGGACMADCTNGNSACGTESLCVGVSQTTSFCIEKCSAPGARSTCRSPGYTCTPLMGQTDGVCLPDCQQPNWGCIAPKTCNATTGLCQ
jgi:hypothetical protein